MATITTIRPPTRRLLLTLRPTTLQSLPPQHFHRAFSSRQLPSSLPLFKSQPHSLPLFKPQPALLQQQRKNQSPYSTSLLRSWSYEEIKDLSQKPRKGLIIIDVREPSELSTTGRIPTAYSMPIISNPDAVFLPPEEFKARFGFDKPGSSSSPSSSSSSEKPITATSDSEGEGEGEGGKGDKVQEVVFYCLAGVRSKRAAEFAARRDGGWEGVRVGDWGGGWEEWVGKGGEVER